MVQSLSEMNRQHRSQPVALVILLMLIFESQGQPTGHIATDPCENDSRFQGHLCGMSRAEGNNLRDLVTNLVTEVNEQREQLNALRERNCSQNDGRLVDHGQRISELREVFVESRFHTERENLAIRGQLNEMKKLVESMQRWNITLLERLDVLQMENDNLSEQLLHLRQENESLREINTELQHRQLSQMNNLQEQLIFLNISVQERTDELRSLQSEHDEQLRLVQQQLAVDEEQATVLRQLNSSLIETVIWQQEMTNSLNEINRTMVERTATLEQDNRNNEEQLKLTNGSLSRELAQLKEQTSQDRRQLTNAPSRLNDTAVAYIRWGRKVCPPNSTVLYNGYAAGTVHSHQGGGSNYLCLPERPEWGRTIDGIQSSGSYIYGAEYEVGATNSPFLTTNNGDMSLQDLNAPCSLCQVTGRSTQLMMPGLRNCPAGWHLQYRGYLVASHRVHYTKNYVCLDEAPEAIHGSHRNEEGALFYPVEAVCGSLPCPQYVSGWEIACVVCVR